jgi:tetratricopeptide (TPR) repeat protein
MSDPLSTNPVRAAEPNDEADREARIEELLLSGLDHYFGGQYERAISVWTRIVFLDRHHDRARAYIERARSALAERQRESDECLHDGVAAYNAGDIDRARDLLTRAVEHGSDSARVFLDRLNRVGPVSIAPGTDHAPRPARTAASRRRMALAPSRREWVVAGLAALAVAVMMLVSGLPIGTWLSELQGAAPTGALQPPVDDPLPIVRASEAALLRARALHADGKLHDALRVLDRIGVGDPDRTEADRLRADIQRDLFAVAGVPVAETIEEASRP